MKKFFSMLVSMLSLSVSLFSQPSYNIEERTGAGLALNKGYIVVNNHIVEGTEQIVVYASKDSAHGYNASVVMADKNSDIAILKISDSSFVGYENVPYRFRTKKAKRGESVVAFKQFAKVEVGKGIIMKSEKNVDDVMFYKVSISNTPTNSGAPLFDKNGDVLGIMNAKYNKDGGIGYAYKSNLLVTMIESLPEDGVLPEKNLISKLSETEKNEKIGSFIVKVIGRRKKDKGSVKNNNGEKVKQDKPTITVPKNDTIAKLAVNTQRTISLEGYWRDAHIEGVELLEKETLVHIAVQNLRPQNGRFNVDKGTEMVVDGNNYTLLDTRNIKIAPDLTFFPHTEPIPYPMIPPFVGTSVFHFTLVFPALPTIPKTITIYEPDSDLKGRGEWRFENVILTKKK